MKIEMPSGLQVEVTYVKHLRTLTNGSGCTSGRNIDVDLYRTSDGRLVVATSPEVDSRAIPQVDPDRTPEDYMFVEL